MKANTYDTTGNFQSVGQSQTAVPNVSMTSEQRALCQRTMGWRNLLNPMPGEARKNQSHHGNAQHFDMLSGISGTGPRTLLLLTPSLSKTAFPSFFGASSEGPPLQVPQSHPSPKHLRSIKPCLSDDRQASIEATASQDYAQYDADRCTISYPQFTLSANNATSLARVDSQDSLSPFIQVAIDNHTGSKATAQKRKTRATICKEHRQRKKTKEQKPSQNIITRLEH